MVVVPLKGVKQDDQKHHLLTDPQAPDIYQLKRVLIKGTKKRISKGRHHKEFVLPKRKKAHLMQQQNYNLNGTQGGP